MSTPRTTLAEAFRTDTEYTVHAFPYFPSEVRAPVISVWRTDVDPHPANPNALRHSIQINIFLGVSLEERVEAAADDALDAVMLSLQRLAVVGGITAKRTVFGDEQSGTFQGWLITCHADSANVYKSQILTEGQ